jgi:hypothetical protein
MVVVGYLVRGLDRRMLRVKWKVVWGWRFEGRGVLPLLALEI